MPTARSSSMPMPYSCSMTSGLSRCFRTTRLFRNAWSATAPSTIGTAKNMLPEGSKKGGCRHVDDLCSTPVRRVDDCLRDRFTQTLKYSVRKKQRRKEYVACFFICDYYFGRVDTWRRKMIPAASDCTNTPRAAFGGATALRCSAVPALCFHAQRVLPAGPPRKKHRQSGALSWWTCAGSNRGLTEFVCGHYTFSL